MKTKRTKKLIPVKAEPTVPSEPVKIPAPKRKPDSKTVVHPKSAKQEEKSPKAEPSAPRYLRTVNLLQ